MTQQPLRVLLADDEASLREPLARFLSQTYDYQVDTAADAQGILTWLEEKRGDYDVILIDDLLTPKPGQAPEPLGVVLTKEIKNRYPDIEIIVFTGWGMKSALETLRAGAYRYLAKPFNSEELGLLIQTAADHRRLKGIAHEKQVLEQLMKTSPALLSGQSLSEVLDVILRGVQASGFDRVRLYLLSEDKQRMVGRAQVGMEGKFIGFEMPVADNIHTRKLLADPRPYVFESKDEQPVPYEQELAKEDVKQWADIPLLLRGEVIGKLSVDNKFSQRPISEAELGPVALFASQAAAAIENARLRAKEQEATQKAAQRARNLEAIQEVTTAISSMLELDQILKATCQAVVELFGVEHSGLVLFEPDYEKGQVMAEYPDLGTYGLEVPIRGVPAEAQLIASQKPLVLSEVDDRSSLGPVCDIFDQFNICSILIVPVVIKNQVLGSFSLDAIGHSRTFTNEEIEMCQIFAAQVAVALENAQLFKQLETLRQTTLAITSELDHDSLLTTIIQQAVALLQAKSGGIYRYYAEHGDLTIIADYGRSEDILGNTLKVGEGIAGRLVQNDQAFMIVEDYHGWEGKAPLYANKHLFGAVVEVPLEWQEQIIGILYVDDDVGRAFTAEDADLLRLFADHAAIAMVNAELVAQLSEQKDHWARLVASSPNGVIAIDTKGKVTGFNARAEEILNYQSNEVLGKSVTSLYGNPQEAYEVSRLLYTAPDGRLVNHQTSVRTKQGERIPIRLAATQLVDAQGNRIGSIGYFEDLRSIKEAEKRLELLVKASNTVVKAENLTDGLQSLAEMMVTFLDTSFCHISLLDESQAYLIPTAAYPHPALDDGLNWQPGLGERIPIADRTGLAEFLREGQPTVFRIDDQQGQPLLTAWSQGLGLAQAMQSVLIIPLRTSNGVVGQLYLGELRSWQCAPFSEEKEKTAIGIANQTTVLTDRLRLHEITQRRQHLLTALDEASRNIRAEKETFKLLQEVVRLAAELVSCTAGGLYINRPQLKALELSVIYELPHALIDHRLPHAEGLVGLVAQTGQPQLRHDYSHWPEREDIFEAYAFKTVVGVPLKQAGEVEAVLFVADQAGSRRLTQTDLDILERFAVQASIALHTSRLLSQEQRMFGQLAFFHKISDYIQAAGDLDKILHVVLTGVTAGYGLGFNRAALLLLDEKQEHLIGRMGIGHLDETRAHRDWERDRQEGLFDFGQYLKALEQDNFPPTPVGEKIRDLYLPVDPTETDVFSQVVIEGRCTLVTQEELDKLPGSFIDAFEPDLPLVVVPLIARDQVTGLLVADNKFTGSPITAEDIEVLLTFANTAAIAIDNIQLWHETEAARERLGSFFEASNMLVSSQAPEQVLQNTVEQACLAAGASGVSMVLIDQLDQARSLITVGTDASIDLKDVIRSDGLSMQVMRTGEPEIIEDISAQQDRVNPSMFRRGIAAALCLPVSLEGKRIGVMWLHYKQSHYFSKDEVEALQLYVNQAVIAYDNARRIKELEYMRQAAEALSRVAETPKVLKQIVQHACKVLGADTAITLLYDASQNKFSVDDSVTSGLPRETLVKFLNGRSWESSTDFIVLKQGWFGVADIEDEEENSHLGQLTQEFLRFIGMRSTQGIALKVDEDQLGMLYANYKQPRFFNMAEQRTARTFANHAALALKTAKLLDQVKKTHTTARLVAEVTALEDLQATLDSVVKGMQDALGCDAVTLHSYDPNLEQFSSFKATIGLQYPEEMGKPKGPRQRSTLHNILALNNLHLAEDAIADPVVGGSFVERESIVSSACIPLVVRGRKVGVMFVNYRNQHRFTEEELENIRLFANQAAVAIRNAQLYERVQKRAGTLQALYEAGRAVTGSLKLDEILFYIAEQAWRLIEAHGRKAHFSHLALLDGTKLQFRAAYPPQYLSGLLTIVGEIRLDQNEHIGVTGRTFKTGQAQLVSDVSQDTDYITYDPQIRSQLAAPIKIGEQVIGVINVEHPDPGIFSVQDQQALEALAGYAAIAIENARLFEQTQRRARLLDAAAQVARGATAILDMAKLLQRTVRLISDVFGYYHTGVFLLENNHGYAVLQATYPQTGPGMLEIGYKLKVGQEGIVGLVTKTGKAHLALDVKKHPHYKANPNLPDTQSEMVFPLIVRGEVIGALDVQSTGVVNLQDEDIATLQTMADQLANAIRNAQLYQEVTERLEEANALLQAAVSLTGAAELEEVLRLIMVEAMKLMETEETSILFWDAQAEKFTQALKIVGKGKLQPYTSRARSQGGRTRKIIDEKKPIAIADAQKIPGFNPAFLEKGHRASLGVPLLCRGEAIGVLYVRSDEPRQFSKRQITLLEGMASQAAVAIDRARQYEELIKAQGQIGAATAVAWMGMVSAVWRHAVANDATTIEDRVVLAQQDMDTGVSIEKLRTRLDDIAAMAHKIREAPITAPLGTEEDVGSISINELLQERLSQLWEREPYESVELQRDFRLKDTATVRASPEWLRRAFDLLIDNAVEAMTQSSTRQLTITTQQVDRQVEIIIADTGPGIPEEVRPNLFQKPIKKLKGAQGLGMGLLITQTILHTYRGEVHIKSTDSMGTAMQVLLPLESE